MKTPSINKLKKLKFCYNIKALLSRNKEACKRYVGQKNHLFLTLSKKRILNLTWIFSILSISPGK
ncbi:MAG: hypothetical protein B7Y25_03600 [Alphaproteobacteria bacterium 16-39-46]|nr:MAG: hypothetical protein B7Y25_03600 [Alphaproteobacteria bacterium 16-39-46]OZA43245.1 MAG: hypothetical protein B7X84_03825 [Alphaproteobacteria bacterium 17-39-52]